MVLIGRRDAVHDGMSFMAPDVGDFLGEVDTDARAKGLANKAIKLRRTTRKLPRMRLRLAGLHLRSAGGRTDLRLSSRRYLQAAFASEAVQPRHPGRGHHCLRIVHLASSQVTVVRFPQAHTPWHRGRLLRLSGLRVHPRSTGTDPGDAIRWLITPPRGARSVGAIAWVIRIVGDVSSLRRLPPPAASR